jgi:DNA-directed RNA polymerase subunit beta
MRSQLMEGLFFDPKRYDLATVGRYKLTKKLGWKRRILGKDPGGAIGR